MKPEN